MQQFTLILTGVCLVVVIVASVGANEYSVGLMPRPGYASPFLVAEANGFFTEHGLTIATTIYLTVPEYANAFVNQRKDLFCLWSSSHINFLLSGNASMSIGAISYEHGAIKLISKPDVANIADQKVSVLADTLTYRWLVWSYLKSQNIDLTRITMVVLPLETALENFLIGRVPIVTLGGTYVDKAVQAGGVLGGELTPQMTLGSILISQQTYRAMPKEDLKRLWRALIKALQWIDDPANEDAYLRILQKAFADDPNWTQITTVEALRKTRLQEITIPAQELYRYNTAFLEETYATATQVLIDMDMPHEFTYTDVVDTSALLEVLNEMGLANTP